MQVKVCKRMQSYKTGQVGGRASQVGGITCMFKVKERIIEPYVYINAGFEVVHKI